MRLSKYTVAGLICLLLAFTVLSGCAVFTPSSPATTSPPPETTSPTVPTTEALTNLWDHKDSYIEAMNASPMGNSIQIITDLFEEVTS